MPRPQSYRICFPRFDVPLVPLTNGSTPGTAMVQTLRSSTGTLNSWKEIAQYLDRGVRTIQRWERGLGLPVHRIGKGKRSPVFATVAELNFWFSTVVERSSNPLQLEPTCNRGTGNPRIQSLRQSCLTMRNLSQTMAENCARQRRQAEIAREQMNKLRLRISRAKLKISGPGWELGDLISNYPQPGSTSLAAAPPPSSAIRHGRWRPTSAL